MPITDLPDSATRIDAVLARETARRPTFALISHPHAGKTTHTDTLLLSGAASHPAGPVHASRSARRAATARRAREPHGGS